ncbi:MAG TPA: hypothetical protein VNR60_04150 [Croceibacterium sp.]|nr:hypothetical protein [Croceibacterium sp.]
MLAPAKARAATSQPFIIPSDFFIFLVKDCGRRGREVKLRLDYSGSLLAKEPKGTTARK